MRNSPSGGYIEERKARKMKIFCKVMSLVFLFIGMIEFLVPFDNHILYALWMMGLAIIMQLLYMENE
jgi:hypothetical protein